MTVAAPTLSSMLIRRIDGIEWPAAGSWELPRGGSLDVCRPHRLRSNRTRLRVRGGTLDVDERGLHSTLDLRLDAAAPSATGGGLAVHATVTAADADGMWSVAGSALVDDIWHPLAGTVAYCGVYRTAWRATVWLELALTVFAPAWRPGWPDSDLSGQLDASAPDHCGD